MTDDIVTKLEFLLKEGAAIIKDQADGIERLRAAIRHLYFNEGVCYGENCEQCGLVFGLCDNQAVRGE